MNIERMEETIKLLRNTELEFDYSEWGSVEDCGTAACAGGLMTLYPPFRAQGLYHDERNLQPRYEDADGFIWRGAYALAVFLDIDEEDAENAFIDLDCMLGKNCNEITANDVADFLELLIKEEEEKEKAND